MWSVCYEELQTLSRLLPDRGLYTFSRSQFYVRRKGMGTLFLDAPWPPRLSFGMDSGRSNASQATSAGGRPRKSFLFCLTH